MEWVYGGLLIALALAVGGTGLCFSFSNAERYPDKAGWCCKWGKVICFVLIGIIAVLRLLGL